MTVALVPPVVVLSLGTTRLMQATLDRQIGVTLDYVTMQNTLAVNRGLSELHALVEQRAEHIQETVTAILAEGEVGDLVAQGGYAAAGARLASALEPANASMITVLARDGRTLARATEAKAYGDRVLWEQRSVGDGYVTDLRQVVSAALAGRATRGIVVLSASALRAERVAPGAAIPDFTKAGDLLSDQAWTLLATGREREARGLAVAALVPVPDGQGRIRGAALAARLVNRDPELARTYRRLSERWMAVCLGKVVIEGNLPTDRTSVVGQVIPDDLADPLLRQGKQRWTQRLDSTGVELNAAARALRDVNGIVVGMLIVASPLTELQRELDRMEADAARAESRALFALLVWLSVGAAVALVSASLAARGITRPIRLLRAGARRIGEGDFSHRLHVRTGDELEQLAGEFNQMAAHLQRVRDQERLAVIGRMASGIVHDIQNTITSIRGYAQLLAEQDLPPDQREEFSAGLVESVQRIADMARDLLEFARGEETKLELRSMSVDQYLQDLRSHLERDLRDTGISLALALDCPELVHVDPARMNRVIRNLAANARDAMGESGRFTIASRCERGYAEVRVSDTGPGIPAEMEGRLFQPFASHGKSYGTGLGLAICKQIVEAHGGTIEARSERGKGATFIIRLPLVRPQEEEPGPS